MRYKKVEGFTFFHVANAFLSQLPLKEDFDGRKLEWDTALDLFYPEVTNAEQSCYLIYLDDEIKPVYVGQYTGLFKDYWLKKNKYISHERHNNIKSALKLGKNVSIWLSVDPYVQLNDGRKININKEIEKTIIETVQPIWNSAETINGAEVGEPVSSIYSKYKKNLSSIEKSIVSEFTTQNLTGYLERLSEKGEQTWAEFQKDKMTRVSRCRHFLDYVSSGIAPEEAIGYVWKEFPSKKKGDGGIKI